jgi:hypothetical protein
MNVMIAVAKIIETILVTTAEVAAYPTSEALLPHCMPRRQPDRATRMPNTMLWKSPIQTVVSVRVS